MNNKIKIITIIGSLILITGGLIGTTSFFIKKNQETETKSNSLVMQNLVLDKTEYTFKNLYEDVVFKVQISPTTCNEKLIWSSSSDSIMLTPNVENSKECSIKVMSKFDTQIVIKISPENSEYKNLAKTIKLNCAADFINTSDDVYININVYKITTSGYEFIQELNEKFKKTDDIYISRYWHVNYKGIDTNKCIIDHVTIDGTNATADQKLDLNSVRKIKVYIKNK